MSDCRIHEIIIRQKTSAKDHTGAVKLKKLVIGHTSLGLLHLLKECELHHTYDLDTSLGKVFEITAEL